MKLVIATGGSGGHIVPAFLVAEELHNQGHEVIVTGAFGPMRDWVMRQGFEVMEIQARGFAGGTCFSRAASLFRAAGAFTQSLKTLKQICPEGVLGFGGYAAFAPVAAAVTARIPAMIHEQNVVPGLANRVLAGGVKRIAVSFQEGRAYFPRRKTVLTGCPGRGPLEGFDRAGTLQEWGLKEGLPTVLALGGSQGSREINRCVLSAVRALMKDHDFQVIHICGRRHDQEVREQYGDVTAPHFVTGFLEEIQKAYHLADLVISRAGAVTLAELSAFQRPAVLVPYPHAGGHQLRNAQAWAREHPAVVIEQPDLNGEKLADEIRAFLSADAASSLKGPARGPAPEKSAHAVAEAFVSLCSTGEPL